MKKLASAVALSLVLAGGAAEAQTLQPQMSSQDVRAAIDPDERHLLVPILMMIFLVLTATGGGGAVQVPT